MAAILFSGAEPVERIGNALSKKRPHVKSGENQRRHLKITHFLYMYIAQGQEKIAPRGQNFDYN